VEDKLRFAIYVNVQITTVALLIFETSEPVRLISTGEYYIDGRLREGEYEHKTARHGSGKFARDDDGDRF